MELLIIAGILLFAAACTPVPPPCSDGSCVLDSQEVIDLMTSRAEIVHAFYGTKAPLPKIVVYAKGNCDGSMPSASGTTLPVHGGRIMVENICAYGTWNASDNTVYMTMLDWKRTISHELLHQYMMDKYGDGDPSHSRPEWAVLVPQAMSLL